MLEFLLEFHQNKKISDAQSKAQSASDKVESINDRLSLQDRKIEMLILVNQAIVELLVKKCRVSEDEILEQIEEIDLRDGIKDGKISNGCRKCFKCDRNYNHRLNKCLYCGYVYDSNQTIISRYKE